MLGKKVVAGPGMRFGDATSSPAVRVSPLFQPHEANSVNAPPFPPFLFRLALFRILAADSLISFFICESFGKLYDLIDELLVIFNALNFAAHSRSPVSGSSGLVLCAIASRSVPSARDDLRRTRSLCSPRVGEAAWGSHMGPV